MPSSRRQPAPGPDAPADGKRTLKKYPNRRLYDTENSGYITVADVKQMVLDGVDFRVVDAKTNEDLTRAILLQIITGVPLGVASLIGVLMLIGIVVTNAIVLIDLVNQHREAGLGVDEAVYAGARDRVRPIVMTALATILALVPKALSLSGGGAFISQPLALVVIGGLFSSTALTLLVVPALYLLIERRRAGRGDPRDPLAEQRRDEQRHAEERRAADREPGGNDPEGETVGAGDGER